MLERHLLPNDRSLTLLRENGVFANNKVIQRLIESLARRSKSILGRLIVRVTLDVDLVTTAAEQLRSEERRKRLGDAVEELGSSRDSEPNLTRRRLVGDGSVVNAASGNTSDMFGMRVGNGGSMSWIIEFGKDVNSTCGCVRDEVLDLSWRVGLRRVVGALARKFRVVRNLEREGLGIDDVPVQGVDL